jgi:hypothetical protein
VQSTAEGATSFGASNTASGQYALVLGRYNLASGYYSFAQGFHINAASYGVSAFGRYNVGGGTADSWVATDPLFELGMGTADGARANAITVLKNGNTTIAGSLTISPMTTAGFVKNDVTTGLLTGGNSITAGDMSALLASANTWTNTNNFKKTSTAALVIEQDDGTDVVNFDTTNKIQTITRDNIPVAEWYDYVSRNYDTDYALLLQNTTAATSSFAQYPPYLKFRGSGYASGAKTMDFILGFKTRNSSADGHFTIGYRDTTTNPTGNYTEFFRITTTGNFTLPIKYYLDSNEAIGIGLNLNTANAVVTEPGGDSFSPSVHLEGKGWKTASTAASQTMSADIYNAPEQGVTNPIGVVKFAFGTNSATSSDTNELARMEFGDRRQVIFNSLLADQDFIVSGDNDTNLFVVDAGTDAVKIGQDSASLVGFYGATAVDQPAHIADPTGGLVVDAEARTAINSINAMLAEIGLTAAS